MFFFFPFLPDQEREEIYICAALRQHFNQEGGQMEIIWRRIGENVLFRGHCNIGWKALGLTLICLSVGKYVEMG